MTARRILVIGATGYVGARLVPLLMDRGERVRVLVRDPDKLRDTDWGDRVDVVAGDVTVQGDVEDAMADVDVVFYLVHSLASADFAAIDSSAATLVAKTAAGAGVSRIVYLGGVRPADDRPLSEHMASRLEVGDVFADGEVAASLVQAAIIIGSGSTSFEILRYLVERLPALPAPGWVDNAVQPVAITDVLHYLVAASDVPDGENVTIDIGCPEVVTYWDVMRRYARVAGLPTPVRLPAPPAPSRLVGALVEKLTPVSADVATPLIQSLHHDMVCDPNAVGGLPPPPGGHRSVDQALRDALEPGADPRPAFDRTSDRRGHPAEPVPTDLLGSGGPRFVERMSRASSASAETLWQTVKNIGGDHGYHGLPLIWGARGLLDRALGGVGGYRGRPDADDLEAGDIIDWWRVETLENRRLVLRAEMKMPGTAWLEFAVAPGDGGGSRLDQTVVFEPSGPLGHAYWWTERVAHIVVFRAMLRGIVKAAQKRHDSVDRAAREGDR